MAALATKDETNSYILHALRANSKILSLDNNHLKHLPAAIIRLTSLVTLSARNNQLTDNDGGLAKTLSNFPQLLSLNLGGNLLSSIPISTASQCSLLSSLYLFNNTITHIDSEALKKLIHLRTLNLNNNELQDLPPEIHFLKKLMALSLAGNKIEELPNELCQLESLEELYLQDNLITKLPQGISKLRKLKQLYLQKNELFQLPPTLGRCKSLRSLDVSRNRIQLFPNEIRKLKLTEFHFEHNPLVPPIPLPSDQANEILPLKEITSRYLVNQLTNDHGLERLIQSNTEASSLLARIGECAICGGPFIHSWLDCVEFINSRKAFNLSHQGQLLPFSIVLCSYSCFNKEHNYYGIAVPPDKN